MKNLNKLCLVLSVGSIFALSISACSDDPATTNTTAGTSSGGSATAGTSSGGSATAGTGTAGTGTAGTGTAGTATAGTSSGGTGTAGTASGGSAGSGGASGGSGGKGGAGGSGGASGGSGGAGGGSGGAPSAACTKWCSGATGLPTKCTGSNLLNEAVNSEAKCLAYCAKPEAAAGLTCWQKHLDFINGAGDQNPHCGHASGKPSGTDAGECNKINP